MHDGTGLVWNDDKWLRRESAASSSTLAGQTERRIAVTAMLSPATHAAWTIN